MTKISGKRIPKLNEVGPDLKIPKFKTDQEELDWLDANHERLAEIARKHGVFVKLVKSEPTKQISIRIPVSDLQTAKKLAQKQGVNYQGILKQAIRRGLAAG